MDLDLEWALDGAQKWLRHGPGGPEWDPEASVQGSGPIGTWPARPGRPARAMLGRAGSVLVIEQEQAWIGVAGGRYEPVPGGRYQALRVMRGDAHCEALWTLVPLGDRVPLHPHERERLGAALWRLLLGRGK